jgi:hypothetical protein
MMLAKVKELYPDASRVFIREVFKNSAGWENFGVDYPLTKNRLSDLKFFGYTMVSLKILDSEGWMITPSSDYSLEELEF